jgi:putative NADH-flavin reductase
MKIGVIGATGKAGTLIAREAAGRGHSVTAIIRPGSAVRLERSYPVIERDIFDIVPEDVAGFDAVVSAFGTPFSKPGNEYQHQTAMESLIKVFQGLKDVRLLVVGGAASLYEDKEKKLLVLEGIPKDFRAVPEHTLRAFENLKASSVNWTFFSPAKTFDAGGPRTGKYIAGTDFVIPNSAGESYCSYADAAVAIVDEIENKAFVGRRFTIVSDTPFNQDAKQLFNIGSCPFIRRGGYFGIYAPMMGGGDYGQAALYIGSRRGAIAAAAGNKLIDFALMYQGEKIPYSVKTSATELLLQSRSGNVRICFAEPSLMLIKGDPGMGLRFDKKMETHEIMKARGNRAWEGVFRWICSMVFNPLKGELKVDAPWKWEQLTTPQVVMDVVPGEDGFLLAIEEFTHAGWVRKAYPSYKEALENVRDEFNAFEKTIPHFDSQLEERRIEACYILWSHMVGPSGKIKRPLMYMFGTGCASEWQMCQNAVALGSIDLEVSTELLLNMLDEASPTGQLPDFYDDMRGIYQMIKPPLQGWALKLLMQKHDLAEKIPRGKLEAMYTGFAKWANWFMEYRDDDHDGIPQNEHGDETGFDDNSAFKISPVMATPELCAYLGLLFEALGDIAKMLGKPVQEYDQWYRRSKEIIEKMITHMWIGGRFVALVNHTHEVVATDSALFYLPIVLGKRLPQHIIDKMAEDLSQEGDLLTPYGIASEKLSSKDFKLGQMVMSLGAVLPPTNILICTGLYDAGKTDLARLIARRYCKAMKDGGLTFLMNPFKGSFGGFAGSWAACAYVILAGLCT